MAVKITLLGDMMLGRSFDEIDPLSLIGHHTSHEVWSQHVQEIMADTLLIGNLETSITDSKDKYPDKAFNFKISPTIFPHLLPQGIGGMAVNLANNHVFDYKDQGLRDTLDTLNKLGIAHVGAGLTKDEARKPTIFKYNDFTIGLIGIADHPLEWVDKINYLDIENGTPETWQSQLDIVEATAAAVDIVIVYLHYGPNWRRNPTPKFEMFNRLLIDSGATIVVGTSPHHLQKVESYKHGIIFYSLGDAIDDYAINDEYRNDLTVITQLQFTHVDSKITLDVEMWPAKIHNMSLDLLNADTSEYNLVRTMLGLK